MHNSMQKIWIISDVVFDNMMILGYVAMTECLKCFVHSVCGLFLISWFFFDTQRFKSYFLNFKASD